MWAQMKVLCKDCQKVTCYWLEMECVTLWIMHCTTEYDFVCHSPESKTFNLEKRRNDGQDCRIIAVEDWMLGKEKNVEKILYLKKKEFLFLIHKRKKFWKNCVVRKDKIFEKILNLKTRKCEFWENFVQGKNCWNWKCDRKNCTENKKILAP